MTVAETLRAWADGADEDMAGPLRELADQYDAEVKDLERHYLTPIADLLHDRFAITSPAETFELIQGLGVAAAKLGEMQASLAAIDEAKAAAAEKARQKLARKREKRAKAVIVIDHALEAIKRACITIENLDLTPEQIAERAAGRN